MYNNFIDEFIDRGYYYQCSNLDLLRDEVSKKKIVAYVGFDCTAKSLHVGNLMQIMILKLLQKHGHTPIIIVGGATTKIGDPTGKDKMRQLISDEIIAENMNGIKKSLSKFIQFDKKENSAIILNNSEWLDKINYIQFLRDYGKLFSVNRILSIESIKTRLEREEHLTFLEFNYMLLQSYDFYHLHTHYDCSLQFGGSDQWGNIITGLDFIKKLTGNNVHAITTPLLTTASGAKMGKSISGAIWINENMLSPYDYYQYWRNTEDADVVKFAKLYAEFSVEQQKEFELLSETNINEAKKRLAFELTKICHGVDNANDALETAVKLFEQNVASENLPTIILTKNELEDGVFIYDIILRSKITDSKSEGRRIIRGRGVKLNDETVLDENKKIDSTNLQDDQILKLSIGKKKHILIKLN
ncbi:MAG: tyrosine--tRNA ligase [Rickettsiaceae bacterium]